MYISPFVAQLIAEERMADTIRALEHSRLIRRVEGFMTSRKWWLPILLALVCLVAFVIR